MRKLKWKLSANGKSLLTNKIFDLFIVICGVTIAFQLNNVKQRSDQSALEQFYLENLVSDIDKDISSMHRILAELQADSAIAGSSLRNYRQAKVSPDTLGKAIISVLSFSTFSYRNDNTYTTLMNSNGLSVISNKSTRTFLSEYYKCYKSIDRFEYVYTEFLLNDFNLFYASFVDYSTGTITNPSILKDIRTNNSLLIAASQLNDGISTYRNAIEKAVALKMELQRGL
ncbi:MAG: hypothetical protein HYZ44_04425 [Bacteroidetes bacterium]|nr:hypothetical protein [Bacteroidota bacterium]